MARGIFISYRRSDTRGTTGRLHDHLLQNGFAKAELFLDIDDIPPGQDYRKYITDKVDQCAVVLVVIGPSWTDARDDGGNRRLDSPYDTLRLEIATALRSQAIVIPVLVEGAALPAPEALPPDIRNLTARQAWPVSDRRFADDVAGLTRHIRQIRGERPPATGKGALPSRHRGLWTGAATLVGLAIAVIVVLAALSDHSPASRDATGAPITETSVLTATVPIATTPASTAPETTAATTTPTTTTNTTTTTTSPSTTVAPTTTVRLPEHFVTSVPRGECTSSAVKRDTGTAASVRRCVGAWLLAQVAGESQYSVYRWDGSRWSFRGMRTLTCAVDFAFLGMSTWDAASFGAGVTETSTCRFNVSYVAEPPTGPLRRGDQGPRVEQLQIRLVNLGLLATKIDDQFGLNTAAAIIDLKLLLGLATPEAVDGIADDQILALLD